MSESRRRGGTASPRGGVVHRLGIGRIALRQLWSRPAPAIAEGLILAAAATLVATVVLIQANVTDQGLRTTVVAAGTSADIFIEQDGIAQPAAYTAFQQLAADRVRAQLGNAVTPGAQFGVSLTLAAQTLDCTVEGPPVRCRLSVATYAGIADHAHIITGRWASNARDGADWEFTASTQATDQSGVPLHLAVGTEYCFQSLNRKRNAPEIWCGRLVGLWLPNGVADPYWAGNVPDSDIVVTQTSFFQILAEIPDSVGASDQQYTPNTSAIRASDADSIVAGINRLRGYSLSSNGLFVSALDSTVSGFFSRQDASSGPILVTTLGLLVIALAAMGFAALHLLQSHVPEVALWRARGWSRSRVWGLYSTEFALLAVLATPCAIVASAAISSAASSSSTTRGTVIWQHLADAAIPALVAASAFLAVLIVLAAVVSGPEISARRQARASTRGRSARRRALDLVFLVAGAGILWYVHQGGVGTTESQSSVLAFVLCAIAVGLIASPSLRLVGLVGRVLSVNRAVGGRLARWEIERDPRQYSQLSLLVMLAVAVSVFATTYVSSDNAGATDRADYQVGANMRATFSTAAGPPQVAALAAALPSGVHAAQAFRDDGRPGQSGLEATVLGIQGTRFWNIAYARRDFASQSLRSLTAKMSAADPDGATVPGSPHALTLSVYGSGVSARIDVQISDAMGDMRILPLGITPAQAGWNELRASLTGVTFPIRVRAITVSPTDIGVAGDVAFRNLRTDSGAIVESFDITDGWWQEDFAPNPAALPIKPTFIRTDGGQPSVDVPVNNEEVLLMPPASSRPLPVLLATQSLADLGLTIGQPFPIHLETVNIELVAVGTFDEFPTYYPGTEDFLAVPMSSLLARMGRLGVVSPWANELWMSVPSGESAAVTSKINSDLTLLNTQLMTDAQARAAALNDPLRSGFAVELGIGAIVALLVVVINFAMHFLAAARNRTTQYAIMRANGVPQSTLRNALIGEQIAVLISGMVAGTVIGLAVAWAVLPVFHLGSLPTDLIPPSPYTIDPVKLAAVVIGTGALSLLTGAVVAGRGARVHVMTAIRALT